MLNCEDHQLLLNSLQDLQSKVRAARTGYNAMIAAGAMAKPDENAYRPTIYYPLRNTRDSKLYATEWLWTKSFTMAPL